MSRLTICDMHFLDGRNGTGLERPKLNIRWLWWSSFPGEVRFLGRSRATAGSSFCTRGRFPERVHPVLDNPATPVMSKAYLTNSQ